MIEKQPPQVIKTANKFSACVRSAIMAGHWREGQGVWSISPGVSVYAICDLVLGFSFHVHVGVEVYV